MNYYDIQIKCQMGLEALNIMETTINSSLEETQSEALLSTLTNEVIAQV